MKQLDVRTRSHREMIDITSQVGAVVTEVSDGVCHVYVPHTTAAVVINEHADPEAFALTEADAFDLPGLDVDALVLAADDADVDVGSATLSRGIQRASGEVGHGLVSLAARQLAMPRHQGPVRAPRVEDHRAPAD